VYNTCGSRVRFANAVVSDCVDRAEGSELLTAGFSRNTRFAKTVRLKWALTPQQTGALLTALRPLARTMVGLAVLTGLRRGELFALRWRNIDEEAKVLTVREAVYDGTFDTPKTEAGSRQLPLPIRLFG
jgi:integrase